MSGTPYSRLGEITRRLSGDQGFTLLEVMVALGTIFVALLALAYTTTIGLSYIGFARQRQAATGIAGELLEDVRGLDYVSLTKGLRDSDLTGDSNIVSCSGLYYFKYCPAQNASAELIVHGPDSASVVPLLPHKGTKGPPSYPNTYSWSVYVTRAIGVPATGAYRVTTIVSWTAAAKKGVASSVQAQTLVYSPPGCVDLSTHPFSAPCQAFFHGTGSIDAGTVTTTGTVTGLTFGSFNVDLRQQNAEIQQEQVVHARGNVKLPRGREEVGSTLTTAGELAASSASADNDPGSSASTYNSQSVGPQPSATLTASGGGNSLSVTASGSDSGTTISTTSAGGSNSCNSQTDNLACSYATSSVGNGVQEVLSLGSAIGSATLVSLGNQGSTSTVYARRIIPVSANVGNVRETISRSIPDVSIGGMPSGITAPTGWAGYWVKLTGFAASSQCEAGTDSSAPTRSITGGTISAWGNTGYTSTTVTTAGGTLNVANVNYQKQNANGDSIRVQISGTVQFAASPAPNDPLSGGGTGLRNDISVTVGSPLIASITYSISQNNTTVANLTFTVDVGTISAHCIYQAAPTV
jgi:prepilin-type N-terminal cleavage/methylation domain-containing protein